MNISTIPFDDHDNEVATAEEVHATSTIPDVVTDDLLFFDVTAVPFDKSIKTDKDLLFYKGIIPITPEPDGPYSFTHAMFNVSNNEM